MGWQTANGQIDGAIASAFASRIGWADYMNSDQTPISVPAGVPTKLTCDAIPTVDGFLPVGVTSLWNGTTSQFDFTELKIGDMVDIRLDGSFETTTVNDSFEVDMIVAIGSPGEFTLPFAAGNRFQPGVNVASRYNSLYIGSSDLINNPSEFRGVASDNAFAFIIDIYIRVIRS